MEFLNQILIFENIVSQSNDELVNSSSSNVFNDDEFFIKFRDCLFNSIIKGEYYHPTFEVKINSIQLELVSFYNIYSEKNESTDIILELLNDLLLHYKFLNKIITDRGKNNYSTELINFELENVFSTFFNYKEISTNDAFHWLFVANVKLAEIDEGYVVDDKTIKILSEIYHKLNSDKLEQFGFYVFISKTIEKCAVLLYKILIRLQKTENNDFEYHVFNDDINIHTLEQFINDEVLKKIKNHYIDYGSFDLLKHNQKISSLLNDESICISDAHLYCKILKNKSQTFSKKNKKTLENSLKTIKDTKLFFENKLKNCSNDKISFQTIINNINNCCFSIECDDIIRNIESNFTFINVQRSLVELKRIYDNYEILENDNYPNFILSKQYIEKYIKLIELIRAQNQSFLDSVEFDYFGLTQEIFQTAYSEISKYKDGVKKCQKNKIMPLYLEIETCVNPSLDVFLDSQYILPANYEFLLDDCEEKRDLLKLKEDIFYSFTPKSIKELNEKLKKDIKDQQYNIITVIGLYASFITFILANVNVLPELIKYSIGAVLGFMLVFGVVISFFILSLKLLFNSNDEIKLPIIGTKVSYISFWIVSVLIISIATLFSINYHVKYSFNEKVKKANSIITTTTFDPKSQKKQSEIKTSETITTSIRKDSIK